MQPVRVVCISLATLVAATLYVGCAAELDVTLEPDATVTPDAAMEEN